MRGIPASVMAALDDDVAALPEPRRDLFVARVTRWYEDLAGGLGMVHGDAAEDLVLRVLRAAAAANAARPEDLHRLDLHRTLRPNWLQDPHMVGYATYVDRYAGTLDELGRRLDHLEELGVTYLHLMPLLAPREGDNDGGYAVADHRRVRDELGTMEDLRDLATTLRDRGMSLVVDLVVNHVADDHDWARRARAGDRRYRDYFLVMEDRAEVDEWEASLPEVFPDFAPGNFTFVPELDAWVWTTFNDFQWDLDWHNPDVFEEFVAIVFDLANLGVEVFRLDAIAFIAKRRHTTCQGLPEVHALTRALRAAARIACPAVAFKAEAIVAPHELLASLGEGEFTGKVSDLAYHNVLMVQVWSLLATRDVRLFARAMSDLPSRPPTATWLTYLRCHDDIGWAIDDAAAAAVGLDGHAHRSFLTEWFTGEFRGSPARGARFQHDPETGDSRVSGTAASLVGIQTGLDRVRGNDPQGPAALDDAIRALRLANAIIAAWGGVPTIWSGDEVGLCNDPDWADDPDHADDNRWMHRPALDWDAVAQRHDDATVAGRVFRDLRQVLATRARLPQLGAAVETQVGPIDNPAVLVTVRNHPTGRFVAVHNVSTEQQLWPGHRAHELGVAGARDELTGRPLPWGGDEATWGHVVLAPRDVLWLVAE